MVFFLYLFVCFFFFSQCDETVTEKESLDQQSKTTTARLGRASKLTFGLAEEAVRWDVSVNLKKKGSHFEKRYYCFVGFEKTFFLSLRFASQILKNKNDFVPC